MKKYLIILIILSFSQYLQAEETFWQKTKNIILDETYKDDPLFKRHRLEIESGIVQLLYNKIGNNSNSGSLFDTNQIDSSVNFYARFSYYFNLDKKNSFRLMVAPLSIAGDGNLDDSFQYGGQNFIEGQVSYKYQFNSYRVTYRRTIFEDEKFSFRIGLTLKLRDALIRLSQGDYYYAESNIGVVPLAHINFEYRPISKLTFVFEGDLAGAPQGRAIDLAFSTRYDINDNVDIAIGYRLLEGGASNKSVYNMAFINYYFCAVGIKF